MYASNPAQLIRLDYASNSTGSAAWVQITAATSTGCAVAEIFDSSGVALILGYGSAGNEKNLIYIMPGGNGRVPVLVPGSTRLAVKAVSSSATSGQLLINLYCR